MACLHGLGGPAQVGQDPQTVLHQSARLNSSMNSVHPCGLPTLEDFCRMGMPARSKPVQLLCSETAQPRDT